MTEDGAFYGLFTVNVWGTPAPQGSKKAYGWRSKDTGKIRTRVVEQLDESIKIWRSYVVDAARQAMNGRQPLQGPLAATIVFTFKRPKSHYRTGRNAHLLRDGAPAAPAGAPDLSKLLRSTEDALTDAGVWADDALVVEYDRAAKVYCGEDEYALELPGAVIAVRRWHPRPSWDSAGSYIVPAGYSVGGPP